MQSQNSSSLVSLTLSIHLKASKFQTQPHKLQPIQIHWKWW